MPRNLKAYIPLSNGKLSNFTYGEFVTSSTAQRLGIKLEPTEEQWKNIETLVDKCLQPIRDKFGPIRINSGFRSVELSLKIGSSANSNHNFGYAADIEPIDTKVKLIDILEFAWNNTPCTELIAEYFPNGWVHVAYNPNKEARQLKLKDEKHNYTQLALDDIKKIYVNV